MVINTYLRTLLVTADSLIFASLLEVFEEEVCVEEYFHGLEIVFLLEIILDKLFFRGIGVEDAAEGFVAIVSFRLCCRPCRGNELLGVGGQLLLQQFDAVRLRHVDRHINCSSLSRFA